MPDVLYQLDAADIPFGSEPVVNKRCLSIGHGERVALIGRSGHKIHAGMLGIATLGFSIDNALLDLRFDRALVLIVITAVMNIFVDALSRWLRRRADAGLQSRQSCGD